MFPRKIFKRTLPIKLFKDSRCYFLKRSEYIIDTRQRIDPRVYSFSIFIRQKFWKKNVQH